MIVDSSALIALLKHEPEAKIFAKAMEAAEVLRVSAGTYVEAFMVAEARQNPRLTARLEEILQHPNPA